ncbi:glycosyltransferase [Aestuariivivens sediminicola]|uniref:glycosyltransferase n=1 Tax=Aestuariivivens sediminicola TaxID=2913560 RepID=UPI001F5A1F5C|nr:glycosyltransferase [Aestuariivivens sediminicola]
MQILDILFYLFLGVVFSQVILYVFVYGKFIFKKPAQLTACEAPVSVIICAKNEAENLKRFLPDIIHQNHPVFEIVLINDSSNDDTLEVMKTFAEQHANIKIVDVKAVETFWGNKKYALTLGIKAAKHNLLLFSDADCKPVSKHWIREMLSHFNGQKSIVLGFGGHTKVKRSLLNKLIRFETLTTAVRYFSFALHRMPYMGVGRNMAYKKELFFDANGFINHMRVKSGDDDLFINQVATPGNTAICFSKNSFTASPPKTNFKEWLNQKRRHITTASYYRFKHKILLALIYAFQVQFWLLATLLLIVSHKWQIVLALVLIRLSIQYIVFALAAKKLNSKDLIVLLPFLEIFLISIQLFIFITNLISKPIHWK